MSESVTLGASLAKSFAFSLLFSNTNNQICPPVSYQWRIHPFITDASPPPVTSSPSPTPTSSPLTARTAIPLSIVCANPVLYLCGRSSCPLNCTVTMDEPLIEHTATDGGNANVERERDESIFNKNITVSVPFPLSLVLSVSSPSLTMPTDIASWQQSLLFSSPLVLLHLLPHPHALVSVSSTALHHSGAY